ncbi:gp060 [Rhodococcus phage ReqiPepy6]|uniref:Gp060 n=1 Tax=Rhodococcus phage ReqiPepy6 TaxID=691965 RepID=D4P7H1_9CAUD|nr:gp060 [Rhodococcus phage ReqiPepy6]ADD80951.1 gp060 [Rhodococcus phage ReqiPepy6]
MCEAGTCRPCRLEDRLTDRVMGTTRDYIEFVKLPTVEQNMANRKIHGLSLISSTNSKVQRQTPPPGNLSSKESIAARKKRENAKRKANRELRNGRLYSLGCPEHGTPSGYKHWHCRCAPCTDAHTKERNGSYQGKQVG